MAHASECDSCGDLFKPVKGTVTLEYNVCLGGNNYMGFSADEHDDRFSLCPKCSASFLAFIKHEGERGDGVPGVPLDHKDALRWRWWQRWWCDGKDDMATINSLEYDGEDPAAMNAAVDVEIAKSEYSGSTD